MPAAVETMAWTNEVPWHGLGVRVDNKQTVASMLKAASLNWKVEKRAMYLNGDKDPIPGFFALTRDSDSKVFDVCGSQYTPVQNERAFEFFKEFVEGGKATMETAGALRGGRLVWGLANLNASFKLAGGDEVKGYLLCGCPHQQGKSLLFKFTSVRVVCANTFAAALGDGRAEWRRHHRNEFTDDAIEQGKVALGIARDQLGEFEAACRKMQAKKLTEQKAIQILCPIFAKNVDPSDIKKDFDKNATDTMKKVVSAAYKAPGAQPETGWGWFNAVTYWADHMASRTADKRLTNSWVGKTANMKQRAMDAILVA